LPSTVKMPHRRHNIMSLGPSNHQYTHFKTLCLTQIFGSVKVVASASTILHIHQNWGISLSFANETIFRDNCIRYNTKKNTNLPCTTPFFNHVHCTSFTTFFFNHVQCTSINTTCFSNRSNVPTFGKVKTFSS
jgi:hypothetical protein